MYYLSWCNNPIIYLPPKICNHYKVQSLETQYTVRSINFGTDLFNTKSRAIYRSTHYVLSTNIRSHTEFRLFVLDSIRFITCLVKSVFFIRHGWRKWTESCHRILFQIRSICDRNTSTVQKAYGNEVLNQSNVFRWFSRFRDGKELVGDGERGGLQNRIELR